MEPVKVDLRKGWLELPEKMTDIQLPLVQRRGTTHKHPCVKEEVIITTNHFLAKIPQLPKVLYNYAVTTTRVVKKDGKATPPKKLPKDLKIKIIRYACTQIKIAFQKKTNKIVGLVSDFAATAWATDRIEKVFEGLEFVYAADEIPEAGGSGEFSVKFEATGGNIRTDGLGPILENLQQQLTHMPNKMERVDAISAAYNVMLKNLGEGRYLPLGRSALILIPELDGIALGEGLVNWSGLSVNYNFGWKPYLNIDRKLCIFKLKLYFWFFMLFLLHS
jgi:hypothetical protein